MGNDDDDNNNNNINNLCTRKYKIKHPSLIARPGFLPR